MESENRFRIPKRFKMFGTTVEVEHRHDMIDGRNILGEANYNAPKISLQSSSESHPINDGKIEQTFFHELVHFLFFLGAEEAELKFSKDYTKLHQEEELINRVSALLHQALTTMEYEDGIEENVPVAGLKSLKLVGRLKIDIEDYTKAKGSSRIIYHASEVIPIRFAGNGIGSDVRYYSALDLNADPVIILHESAFDQIHNVLDHGRSRI